VASNRSAAIEAVRATARHRPAIAPFSFRKVARDAARRELIIPFGGAGYLARFEVGSPSRVVVLALRHQREEDDH
jgi:hypothetical protein